MASLLISTLKSKKSLWFPYQQIRWLGGYSGSHQAKLLIALLRGHEWVGVIVMFNDDIDALGSTLDFKVPLLFFPRV